MALGNSRNRSVDALRKRRSETHLEDIVLSVEPNFTDAADCGRALAKVRQALGTMAAAQKSALEMAFFEGLTHTEIAEKTGEPLGTIKTRIRAGRVSSALLPGGPVLAIQGSGLMGARQQWTRKYRAFS